MRNATKFALARSFRQRDTLAFGISGSIFFALWSMPMSYVETFPTPWAQILKLLIPFFISYALYFVFWMLWYPLNKIFEPKGGFRYFVFNKIGKRMLAVALIIGGYVLIAIGTIVFLSDRHEPALTPIISSEDRGLLKYNALVFKAEKFKIETKEIRNQANLALAMINKDNNSILIPKNQRTDIMPRGAFGQPTISGIITQLDSQLQKDFPQEHLSEFKYPDDGSIIYTPAPNEPKSLPEDEKAEFRKDTYLSDWQKNRIHHIISLYDQKERQIEDEIKDYVMSNIL